MDMRTALMEGSMNTISFSLRLTLTGFSSSSLDCRASTSGLLCRSTSCDGKLRRHIDACSVLRTASRYGLSVFD